MTKGLLILLMFSLIPVLAVAKEEKESDRFLQECEHALDILASETPKLIDMKAMSCIGSIDRIHSNSYAPVRSAASICINEEKPISPKSKGGMERYKARASQRIRVVVDFIKKHPEVLTWSRNELLLGAYVYAYPCKSN